MHIAKALTIAGSDSGGGAGIQADLKTFAAHGVYGTTAVAAVTAQNTLGVIDFEPLSADLVTAQIEAIAADIGVHAAKTGMLATAAIVKGGHFPSKDIVDLLYDGQKFFEFRSERVEGHNTHGTGCTFAAAVASQLALGRTLQEAIPLAQEYVAGGIRHALSIGHGHGPLDHFWKLHRAKPVPIDM